MARATIAEGVGTATVARRRGPALWRLVPLAFYLLAFTLVRGDLARLPGGVGDLSLHLYFAAMGLYVGGMFFYFAFFAYRTEALRWVAIALVAPGAAIHVAAMMASSGVLVSSFVFAALYLVKDRSASAKSWLNGSAIAARLPSLETLDRLTFRAILLGFPIWTFGTMAGAIWGEHAWGRWWGWDPKETWAAITWIVYAIYLHSHSLRAWRGRRTALIATAGFLSIMVTLY